MLGANISRFVLDPKSAEFNDLALEAFKSQCSRRESYRKYCVKRERTPESVSNWRGIPLVPTRALDSQNRVAAFSAETSQPADTDLTELNDLKAAVLDTAFSSAVPASMAHPAMLSLLPRLAEKSPLTSVVGHLFTTFGGANSLRAIATTGLKTSEIRSWLGGSQRSGRPVVIVTSVEALRKLLDSLKRLDLRFRLPLGSTLVALDFTSILMPENSSQESIDLIHLIDRTSQWLGVPPEKFVGEYRPGRITTAFYSQAGPSSGRDAYRIPHWTRVRTVDPETLEEVAAGESGLIATLDLANIGSAIHVLTEDLGVADGETFRLLGRASPEQLFASAQLAGEMGLVNSTRLWSEHY